MTDFTGKTVIVTGGTTGIGFATAQRFINDGAKVLITGQNKARVEEAVEKLGPNATGTIARAEVAEDAVHLAEVAAAQFSHVDVLFVNAGVTWPAPLGSIDADHIQNQLAINVAGPILTVQAIAPLMGDGGSIIMTTSCLDVLAQPGMSVYSASKAAVRSLARTFQAELGSQGIRVNTVAPGPINTPIYGKLGMSEDDLNAMAQDVVSKVPAGRFGEAEEISGAVAFLASSDASYIRGEEIAIDGGWSTL
ncbi:MAG: NAD(P)-dependent dehydrogenase (short-subunit alcohol dehydrogenase family) [Gammaproteobacteria bacterium]|jgi:NAD(P)-dependent dehydrogenase (short-subunit alcohol dehydrogenase family)